MKIKISNLYEILNVGMYKLFFLPTSRRVVHCNKNKIWLKYRYIDMNDKLPITEVKIDKNRITDRVSYSNIQHI